MHDSTSALQVTDARVQPTQQWPGRQALFDAIITHPSFAACWLTAPQLPRCIASYEPFCATVCAHMQTPAMGCCGCNFSAARSRASHFAFCCLLVLNATTAARKGLKNRLTRLWKGAAGETGPAQVCLCADIGLLHEVQAILFCCGVHLCSLTRHTAACLVCMQPLGFMKQNELKLHTSL